MDEAHREKGRQLARQTQKLVLAVLRLCPNSSASDLAEAAGMPEGVVIVVLKAFARANLARLDGGLWSPVQGELPQEGVPMGQEFLLAFLRLLEEKGKVEKLPGNRWRKKV